MLKINSSVYVLDNSGIKKLKIINFIKKRNKTASFATVADLILTVITEFDIFKKKKTKLKKKDRVVAVIVTVKKKYSKNNGIFVLFSRNRCIPIKITRFILPVAQYTYTPIFFELKLLKRYKTIVLKSKGAY